MGRRSFSREFKLEAVKLVRERGVSVTQASKDLGFPRVCSVAGFAKQARIRSRHFQVAGR